MLTSELVYVKITVFTWDNVPYQALWVLSHVEKINNTAVSEKRAVLSLSFVGGLVT